MNNFEKVTYKQIDETLYKAKLPNGLSVFLLPRPSMAKSFGIFMTNYGSMHNRFTPIKGREEIVVPDGIAHFLEHKLFEKEDRDVFNDFMAQGASPNAYTSFSKTAYLFSATENIEENIEILLDFVQDPYFSDESVEKEKGIIAQEIKMYEDDPTWRSFMGTIQNMYENLPINIDIAGTVSSIEKITKEDLYTCYETFYHPSNMALFVIGKFDVPSLASLIESNQAKKSFEAVDELNVTIPDEPEKVKLARKTIQLPISMSNVTIGIKEEKQSLRGEALLRQELIQEMVLDYLFSQSGAFYERLSVKQLIDESFTYSTTVEEHYNFTLISSNTDDPALFESTVKDMLEETKQLSIDEETFQRMRNKKIGELIWELNSLEQTASQFLHYFFADVNYFDRLSYLQNISLDEVNHYIQHWIDQDRLTSFIIEKEA